MDAEGSALVLGAPLTNSAADSAQLLPDIESVPAALGPVSAVLADAGFGNGEQVEALQARGIEVLVNVQAQAAHLNRRHDFRPADRRSESPVEPKAPWRKAMKDKLQSEEGRALYAKRWSTVEPVFGTIKAAMGFRHFLLRGLEKVRGEWQLVCLAYNFRRLHKLRGAGSAAAAEKAKGRATKRTNKTAGRASCGAFAFGARLKSLFDGWRGGLRYFLTVLKLTTPPTESPTSS